MYCFYNIAIWVIKWRLIFLIYQGQKQWLTELTTLLLFRFGDDPFLSFSSNTGWDSKKALTRSQNDSEFSLVQAINFSPVRGSITVTCGHSVAG